MAGLFDSIYDQGNQGGGSLIERLLLQLQQPQQNSFSGLPSDQAQYGAAPQSPMFATAQMMPQQQPAPQPMPQQPQSQPMPVQAQPPPQMSPQMQQPMQAQQPMVNGIPEAFLQPAGGGVGGFFRGLSDSAHNGSGLLGSVLGGIAGANGQGPGDVHNRQLNAQYTALLQAGVPQPQALLAVISPEYAKTIIPAALGPQPVTSLGNGYVADRKGNIKRAYEPDDQYKVVKTGQNELGREEYEVFNSSTGQHTPIKPSGGGSGVGGLGDMNLTGKDYLASLPKAQANLVQQMVEGTIAPPSSFALAKPYWTNMLAAAKNYDPTFDATAWSGRVAGAKDFSAGKSAEMVRSANQTLHHVGSLLDSFDALDNGSYPLKNKIGNAIAEATGSGAQGSFRTNAHAVAEELSKVFKGSNLSDAEIHAWEQNLHENMSPEQQRTQVAKLGELLRGSLQALEEKRTNSMGPIAAEKAGPLVKEEGQRVLKRIDEWIREGSKGAAPGQTKTGVSWKVVQ